MSYKSRAVYFQHKYIVDNPYFTTLDELHLALVAQCIDGETNAVAGVYMPRLGKKTDVEWQACHVTCCLRWIKAGDTLSRARVVPLPFFNETTQLCVRLGWFLHFFLNFQF